MMQWAVILELALALACIGTAVAFYPIGKQHDPALAMGFIASRTLEATTIFIGAIALLALGTIRSQAPTGIGNPVSATEPSELLLIAVHDWAFLIGPGMLPAVNALLLGTLLYRSRLVPRIIPIVGLIGAPLLLLSALGTIFGLQSQVSPLPGIAALPIALWELSLGIWLVTKGVQTPTVKP